MIYSLQEGRCPLHEASANGHTDVVNILITHVANVDTKDDVRTCNRCMCVYICVSNLYLWFSISATISDDVHL